MFEWGRVLPKCICTVLPGLAGCKEAAPHDLTGSHRGRKHVKGCLKLLQFRRTHHMGSGVHPLFVKEDVVFQGGHAMHFHVMYSSECRMFHRRAGV